MDKNVQFTLIIPESILKKYKKKAEELGVSTNEIIRRILMKGDNKC